MRTQLPLFLKWGIRFGEAYEVAEQAARTVAYADRFELEQEIVRRQTACEDEEGWEEDGSEERLLHEKHMKRCIERTGGMILPQDRRLGPTRGG